MMRIRSHFLRSAFFVLAFGGCATSNQNASVVAPIQAGSESSASFSLEPGDVLRVLVWREKDLGGDFRVDELGRVTLPMLGVFKVGAVQWYQLRDSLLILYSKELKNPSVTLTPMRRVQVLGEVTKPGNYLADPTLSLAGLVALAGGATPGGDLRRVRVVRGGQTIVRSASVESLLINADVRSNDQIFVDRRAWLERNGAFVASAIISTASILVALIRR
jgi:polysaccharide export outer membrane protein